MEKIVRLATWQCQRTASITTRIKTTLASTYEPSSSLVREQHPLQQGLRLIYAVSHLICVRVREQHPLQQGLRQPIKFTNI